MGVRSVRRDAGRWVVMVMAMCAAVLLVGPAAAQAKPHKPKDPEPPIHATAA